MANVVLAAHQAYAYNHAADVPNDVVHALYQNEAAANVILPFLQKAMHFPRVGVNENLWMAVYNSVKSVEFVASCTKGPVGNYPVFIVACRSSVQLAEEVRRGRNLADAMLPLVRSLLDHVPPQRVFSVFSIAKVADAFARVFQNEVTARGAQGIHAFPVPYYDATFSFCSRETFNNNLHLGSAVKGSEKIVIQIRRAAMSDLHGIAAICKAFAETSPPYELTNEKAEKEARAMINNQQAWVHMIAKDEEEPKIACLVATTRESDNVTTITKVFTHDDWRGRGCATRLMHRVCQRILHSHPNANKRVVLYVGNTNDLLPARAVYHKLGFQGLGNGQVQSVPGVEKWLEFGFIGTALGYW